MPTADDYGFDHIISAEMEEELGFDLMFGEAPTDGDMIDVVAGLKEDGSSVLDDEVDFDELHQEDDGDVDGDDFGDELGEDHDTDNAPSGAEGSEEQLDTELALGEGDCPECSMYDDSNDGLGDNTGLGWNGGLGDNEGLGDNNGLEEALGMAGNDFNGADHPGGEDGTQCGEDEPENAANFDDNSLSEALGMAGNDFEGAEHPGGDDGNDDNGDLDDGDYNDSDLIDQVMGEE